MKFLALFVVALSPLLVFGQETGRILLTFPLSEGHPCLSSSIETPFRVSMNNKGLLEPFFSKYHLWSGRPTDIGGLDKMESHGDAIYDPISDAWYASANGCLVRIGEKMKVVADDVQGIDIDVRGDIFVVRESDDKIIVRWIGEKKKEVLFEGSSFFRPKLSPDGTMVVVSESRASGGHMWISTVNGDMKKDLGQGYSPTWHPNGRYILFHRIEHDGYKVLSGDIFVFDLERGKEHRLTCSSEIAEVQPAISYDGRYIAFFDAITRDVYIARIDEFLGSRCDGIR